MTRSKTPEEILPPVSRDEALALVNLAEEAMLRYEGGADELQSALGMLIMGRRYGWRVLVLIHNKRTIRKYEEILGIDVREFFPPTGPLTRRSIGYKLTEALGNFWKAVSGDLKVEGRRELSNK